MTGILDIPVLVVSSPPCLVIKLVALFFPKVLIKPLVRDLLAPPLKSWLPFIPPPRDPIIGTDVSLPELIALLTFLSALLESTPLSSSPWNILAASSPYCARICKVLLLRVLVILPEPPESLLNPSPIPRLRPAPPLPLISLFNAPDVFPNACVLVLNVAALLTAFIP